MTIAGRGSFQQNIRFPDGLPDKLREAAKANGRSMNSEIIVRLEASFGNTNNLGAEISDLIDKHVEQEIAARLRAIAAKLSE